MNTENGLRNSVKPIILTQGKVKLIAKTCPLLDKECITKDCVWFDGQIDSGVCAMTILPVVYWFLKKVEKANPQLNCLNQKLS